MKKLVIRSKSGEASGFRGHFKIERICVGQLLDTPDIDLTVYEKGVKDPHIQVMFSAHDAKALANALNEMVGRVFKGRLSPCLRQKLEGGSGEKERG